MMVSEMKEDLPHLDINISLKDDPMLNHFCNVCKNL